MFVQHKIECHPKEPQSRRFGITHIQLLLLSTVRESIKINDPQINCDEDLYGTLRLTHGLALLHQLKQHRGHCVVKFSRMEGGRRSKCRTLSIIKIWTRESR